MAGVGEASAIFGLVSTSVNLSKTVLDIAMKFKNGKSEIEAFGNDVRTLGEVLNQLRRLLEQRDTKIDSDIHTVIANALKQCGILFSEISAFKDALYSRASNARPLQITLRGKARWVFEAAELQVLQARIDSTKMNLLLLMTLELLQKDLRLGPSEYVRVEKSLTQPGPIDPITEENAQHIRALTSQCGSNVQRLETLEERMMLLESQDRDLGTQRDSIVSFDIATSARSTRDSILNLYSRDSYLQKILSPRKCNFEMAPETPIDEQRFSRRIEDYLWEIPNSLDIRAHTPLSSAFSSVKLNSDPSMSQQNAQDSSSKDAAADDQKSRMQLPGRAKALRSYAARPFDETELSIEKDEILDVSATKSRWWSARNQKGETGVVRARYLDLQDDSDDGESDVASDNDKHEPESHDVPADEDDRQKTPRERDGMISGSLRLNMNSSLETVLPAALRSYNINADSEKYFLYIVHGDQERCLVSGEKPLLLFKDLDRQGKKPMFLLTKRRPTPGDPRSIGANWL